MHAPWTKDETGHFATKLRKGGGERCWQWRANWRADWVRDGNQSSAAYKSAHARRLPPRLVEKEKTDNLPERASLSACFKQQV